MGSVPVVMLDVAGQHRPQVTFTDNQHPVGAFAAAGADPPHTAEPAGPSGEFELDVLDDGRADQAQLPGPVIVG